MNSFFFSLQFVIDSNLKEWYDYFVSGVDGFWCSLWSSKPVWGVRSFLGRFDSYTFPPIKLLCLTNTDLTPISTVFAGLFYILEVYNRNFQNLRKRSLEMKEYKFDSKIYASEVKAVSRYVRRLMVLTMMEVLWIWG